MLVVNGHIQSDRESNQINCWFYLRTGTNVLENETIGSDRTGVYQCVFFIWKHFCLTVNDAITEIKSMVVVLEQGSNVTTNMVLVLCHGSA